MDASICLAFQESSSFFLGFRESALRTCEHVSLQKGDHYGDYQHIDQTCLGFSPKSMSFLLLENFL